jgi:hypothetical protein
MGLVADGLDAAVHPGPVGGVGNHLHGIGIGEVDRGRAVSLGQREPVRFLVPDEDLGGTAKRGAVRGHQPDRPGAEDGHRVPGPDVSQLGAVVAGGKDVRQHGEVVLVLGALGQQRNLVAAWRPPPPRFPAAGLPW